MIVGDKAALPPHTVSGVIKKIICDENTGVRQYLLEFQADGVPHQKWFDEGQLVAVAATEGA